MEHGSRAKVTHRARDMLHAPHESIMVGVHRQVHTNRNPQRSELRVIHIQITVALATWCLEVTARRSSFVDILLPNMSCQQRRGALASVYWRSCPPLLLCNILQFHTAHVARGEEAPVAPARGLINSQALSLVSRLRLTFHIFLIRLGGCSALCSLSSCGPWSSWA
jgi:hypothetical protein